MADAGGEVCRCFVDRMALVHRRIVGGWICQRVEAPPLLDCDACRREGGDVWRWVKA